MRISNAEYISLGVKDPFLYSSTANWDNLVYLKKKELKILITQKQESEDERDQRRVAEATRALRGVILAAASASSIIAAFVGSPTFFGYLAKFFNLMDILSNLGNINVQFGARFKLVIKFIENLKVPEIGFLARLSPLKDSQFDDSDVDAFRKKDRGTRGKMTGGNEEVFIIRGQNFFLSFTIILIWFLRRILGLCYTEKSRIIGSMTYVYHFMIAIFFFDFQMICTTEVSFFDYSRLRGLPGKFFVSIFASMLILGLTVAEFFQAYRAIWSRLIEGERFYTDKKTTKSDQLILEKYTEGTNLKYPGIQNFIILVGNLRCFLIQIIISSLQLLERAQALLVMALNLAFFVFFVKMIRSRPTFSSKLMLVKECFQECCIMVVLVTITLFSFTEKTSFSGSVAYDVVELFAVFSMIGAAGSELVLLCSAMLQNLKSCWKRGRKSAKIEDFVTKNAEKAKKGAGKEKAFGNSSERQSIGFRPSPQNLAKEVNSVKSSHQTGAKMRVNRNKMNYLRRKRMRASKHPSTKK